MSRKPHESFTHHELLTSERLAELLGSTRRGVAEGHRRGLLPRGFKVPGLKGLRWRREDVDRWLADAAKRGAA